MLQIFAAGYQIKKEHGRPMELAFVGEVPTTLQYGGRLRAAGLL